MKPGLSGDFPDAGIKTFNHAIGPRMPWPDKAMFLADHIKWMASGGFSLARGTNSVGKLLTIVSDNDLDLKRSLVEQIPEEGGCRCRGPGRPDLEIDPAGGTINGDKKIFMLRIIRHFGQINSLYTRKEHSLKQVPGTE